MSTRFPVQHSAADRESFDKFVRMHLEQQLVPVAYRYAGLRELPYATAMDVLNIALARVWVKAWPRLAKETDDRRLATIYRLHAAGSPRTAPHAAPVQH